MHEALETQHQKPPRSGRTRLHSTHPHLHPHTHHPLLINLRIDPALTSKPAMRLHQHPSKCQQQHAGPHWSLPFFGAVAAAALLLLAAGAVAGFGAASSQLLWSNRESTENSAGSCRSFLSRRLLWEM